MIVTPRSLLHAARRAARFNPGPGGIRGAAHAPSGVIVEAYSGPIPYVREWRYTIGDEARVYLERVDAKTATAELDRILPP